MGPCASSPETRDVQVREIRVICSAVNGLSGLSGGKSMLSLPGILLGVMLSAATLHAQDTVRYTIVMAKGPAGYTKAWTDASGARHYYTEWNDRGRGPAISQTVVLGADGFPVRMDITGVDYLKSPVEEHYLAETVTQ